MKRNGPPGPRGHWLYGSLRDRNRDPLGFYTRCAREYGDVVTVRYARQRMVLLSHPQDIERILVSDQ